MTTKTQEQLDHEDTLFTLGVCAAVSFLVSECDIPHMVGSEITANTIAKYLQRFRDVDPAMYDNAKELCKLLVQRRDQIDAEVQAAVREFCDKHAH